MSGDAQAEVGHYASVLRSGRLRVGNSWFSSLLLRQDGGWRLMPSDPSWDIMPVANPALHFAERRVFLLLAIDRTARFTQVVIGGPQPL